jgi:hypothetical protein
MFLSKYSLDRNNTIASLFRTQYTPDFLIGSRLINKKPVFRKLIIGCFYIRIYSYSYVLKWTHRYITSQDSRWRHPYIHGLCTGMVCTWRPLVEIFSILLSQAKVCREIERYICERKRKWESSKVGWQELLVWFYTTGGWRRRCKQTDVPIQVNISWYRHLESREVIYPWVNQSEPYPQK